MYTIVMMMLVALAVALPGGLSEPQNVNGTAGQNITLHTGVTGLHSDYQVVWHHGSQQTTLLNFDEGKMLFKGSERFHLDRETGSLTIRSLSLNDSGLYVGKIINEHLSTHPFNLTVGVAVALTGGLSEPQKVNGTAGQNITLYTGVTGLHEPDPIPSPLDANQRRHVRLGVIGTLIVLFVATCIVLCARAVRQKRMNGECPESPSSTEDN